MLIGIGNIYLNSMHALHGAGIKDKLRLGHIKVLYNIKLKNYCFLINNLFLQYSEAKYGISNDLINIMNSSFRAVFF